MGQKDRRQRARDERARGSYDMPPHDMRERGIYGGEPYRQGYYGAEDVGNWSPYEARDPSGRGGGFPSSWAGNERGGRMGWPRYGQGQGRYEQGSDLGSYERGGLGRREHAQGRRGSPHGDWQEWGGGEYSGDTGRDYGGDWRSQGQRDYGHRDYGQAGSWRYREQGSEAGPEHTTGAGWGERMGQGWLREDGGSGRMAGPHRGRGPRGYTRSDERIGEDVNDRLADDPYLDASEIEVGVSGGEVTLSGTVDSRQAKRRAEDLVDAVSGVKHCQNNLRVREREEGGMARGGEESGRAARAGSSRNR